MTAFTTIDAPMLRRWPLPDIAGDADKEARGQVLVVAGSREIAGAALLSTNAALRAGAGKVTIATGESFALQIALAVPEARVIGLPETAEGGFANGALALIDEVVAESDVVLIGPGMTDESATCELTSALLALPGNAPFVVDALAMKVIHNLARFMRPVLVTPHAGEMAGLLGISKDAVQTDAPANATKAAHEWNAVVVLKGALTLIAEPHGKGWQHESHQPGLATSGSGDVLAGVIAGLIAQKASLEQAAAWGVVMHAQAAEALSRQRGKIGYLARELLDELKR